MMSRNPNWKEAVHEIALYQQAASVAELKHECRTDNVIEGNEPPDHVHD